MILVNPRAEILTNHWLSKAVQNLLCPGETRNTSAWLGRTNSPSLLDTVFDAHTQAPVQGWGPAKPRTDD
ncbi:hypothetical protein SBV1_2910008 [Verrucomicrobia bacterium]|nr:hypothetical protein SBV1_2910008 [Verrucomicrobiota bacterium]